MRLAVINKEKCKPTLCAHECKKYCPVEKKEADSCITIGEKALINENTCIGCQICVKRCPFDAIDIINLPSVEEKDIVHRYGANGFALYGIPIPQKGQIIGLLGRNGIGKSTAVKLLSNQEIINLGRENSSFSDIKDFFKGNEVIKYFEKINDMKVSYKPQNLGSLAVPLKVRDIIMKRLEGENSSEKEKISLIEKNATSLEIVQVLDNDLSKLSGGELQRVAILAATIKDADVYFFDEPLAYLDIRQRLVVSDYIASLAKDKTVVVVEHDLLMLDYITDAIHIFFGSQGSYGIVSGPKTSKYGVNAYLEGFLKEENMRFRDKPLNFKFTKNESLKGHKIGEWQDFSVSFDSGFSLDVPRGDIFSNHVVGILGKNGTGKTSFVRALVGELETNKGVLDTKLNISYKKQYLENADNESLVREVVFKNKISKKMLNTFNLAAILDKKVQTLSGGELQRLFLAEALSKDADLYLIDEPSAYLDVEERISVAKAIKEIMTEKEKTAFVIDHDLLLVSYLADSIINFDGEPGVKARASNQVSFEKGVTSLLKSLDITLRKDSETGRPRINKKGSVLDREQKKSGTWAVF